MRAGSRLLSLVALAACASALGATELPADDLEFSVRAAQIFSSAPARVQVVDGSSVTASDGAISIGRDFLQSAHRYKENIAPSIVRFAILHEAWHLHQKVDEPALRECRADFMASYAYGRQLLTDNASRPTDLDALGRALVALEEGVPRFLEATAVRSRDESSYLDPQGRYFSVRLGLARAFLDLDDSQDAGLVKLANAHLRRNDIVPASRLAPSEYSEFVCRQLAGASELIEVPVTADSPDLELHGPLISRTLSLANGSDRPIRFAAIAFLGARGPARSGSLADLSVYDLRMIDVELAPRETRTIEVSFLRPKARVPAGQTLFVSLPGFAESHTYQAQFKPSKNEPPCSMLGDDAVAGFILRLAQDAATKFSNVKGARISDDALPFLKTYRLGVPKPKGIVLANLHTGSDYAMINLMGEVFEDESLAEERFLAALDVFRRSCKDGSSIKFTRVSDPDDDTGVLESEAFRIAPFAHLTIRLERLPFRADQLTIIDDQFHVVWHIHAH